jgi:hypothetical protein
MGQSSTETVKEIEDLRGRLEEEIRELEDRLPRPARWAKRLVGVAVGGGVAGTALMMGVRRLRKRRKPARRALRNAVPETVVNVIPDRWAVRLEDALRNERLKTLAGAAAAAWFVLRLAELRQLRRVNRALISGR